MVKVKLSKLRRRPFQKTVPVRSIAGRACGLLALRLLAHALVDGRSMRIFQRSSDRAACTRAVPGMLTSAAIIRRTSSGSTSARLTPAKALAEASARVGAHCVASVLHHGRKRG